MTLNWHKKYQDLKNKVRTEEEEIEFQKMEQFLLTYQREKDASFQRRAKEAREEGKSPIVFSTE